MLAAQRNNRHFIGYEIEEQYYKIAQQRLEMVELPTSL